jgi:hypothetical protein
MINYDYAEFDPEEALNNGMDARSSLNIPILEWVRLRKAEKTYKEYFLKIIEASGGDVSGIDRPDQIAFPPIEQLALAEVNELRVSYEEALKEIPGEHDYHG